MDTDFFFHMKLRLHVLYGFAAFRRSLRSRGHGFRHSTISTVAATSAGQKPLSMVDYLSHSLRFSKQDAVAVASKGNLTHLKSTANSDLVLNIFKNYGLDPPQIRQIVSSVPKILTCKANKTLELKIRVFQDLGLSGSDLVSLIRRNPRIFECGLHTRIMPGLQLLRELVGSDDKVVEVINKSRWSYVTNTSIKRISTNVALLQNFGLLNERITKFVLMDPNKLMVNPNLLENRLNYVKEKFGISVESPSFIHALSVLLWSTNKEVEKKMEVFRSFGWSDSDIVLLFTKQPYCLSISEGKIREKLKFFMEGLGYSPSYLMSCNSFFTFSLVKRAIPRNMMLEILKEKKLVSDKKPSLITIVTYSESRFLEFLRGFENHIPSCCEIYIDSVRKVS